MKLADLLELLAFLVAISVILLTPIGFQTPNGASIYLDGVVIDVLAGAELLLIIMIAWRRHR